MVLLKKPLFSYHLFYLHLRIITPPAIHDTEPVPKYLCHQPVNLSYKNSFSGVCYCEIEIVRVMKVRFLRNDYGESALVRVMQIRFFRFEKLSIESLN